MFFQYDGNSKRNTIFLQIRAPAFTPFFCIATCLCGIKITIVVNMINTMKNRVTGFIDNRESASFAPSAMQLKRCYHLVIELVHEINRSHGYIMLVLITFSFIWMVNCSFLVVVSLKELGYLSKLAQNLLVMLAMSTLFAFAIIYGVHRMKSEVIIL